MALHTTLDSGSAVVIPLRTALDSGSAALCHYAQPWIVAVLIVAVLW